MDTFLNTCKLIRIQNCALAAAGVLIGASMAWMKLAYFNSAMAAAAAFLVCAGGNVFNDLRDIETDRINHPERVLPRGLLTVEYANRLVVIMNTAALIIALFANLFVFAMVLSAILLLVAYNRRLKKQAVIGNAVVALSAALTFVTGGLAVNPKMAFSAPGPLVPAIFAFFFHMVREIIKDVQDMEGDRRAGYNTLPHTIGPRPAVLTALVLMTVLSMLTYVPVFMGWFGKLFEVLVVYFIDLPLLVLLILVWGNPTQRMLQVGSTALKVGMALGIIALVVA